MFRRHTRVLALFLIFAAFSALGPIIESCAAGQIGPDGMVTSRCNIGVTTAWERQTSLMRNLAPPAIISLATLVIAVVGVFGFRRMSRATKPVSNNSRRALGVLIGVMLACSVASFVLCLAVLVIG